MTPTVRAFWDEFQRSRGEDLHHCFYEAFLFDDNASSADALARLVLAGTKRATASLAWSFEHEKRPPPRPGSLSVVTDFSGRPVCVIETQAVEVVPFSQVTAEFAAVEGEGDGSLRYWREVHEAFFERECARIGRKADAEMPVLCERFAVVWSPSFKKAPA
jgi:uncharacterized protein YhfF